MSQRPPFDIRVYKKNLRSRYKSLRKNMDPEVKADKDKQILRHLTNMKEYKRCKTLLCYVSTPIEVDTRALIERALEEGKQVAVPYCLDNTRKMKFYLIDSLESLVRRTFGVLEPVPETSRELTDFSGSLCVLPGLSFDRAGYRLGYGGGYYDRFLSKLYTGVTVGICYKVCTRPHLIHGRFDVAARYIVTEAGCRRAEALPQRKKEQAPKS